MTKLTSPFAALLGGAAVQGAGKVAKTAKAKRVPPKATSFAHLRQSGASTHAATAAGQGERSFADRVDAACRKAGKATAPARGSFVARAAAALAKARG